MLYLSYFYGMSWVRVVEIKHKMHVGSESAPYPPPHYLPFLQILFGHLLMKMSPHYNGTANTVFGSSFLNTYYFAAFNLKAAQQT